VRIRITLTKGRTAIATEDITDPKPGDLPIVIGRLLAQARKRLDEQLWTFRIDVKQTAK